MQIEERSLHLCTVKQVYFQDGYLAQSVFIFCEQLKQYWGILLKGGGFYFLQSKSQNWKSTFKTAWCFFLQGFLFMSKRHFLGVRITGMVCIYLCEQLKQNYRLFLKGGGLTLFVLPRPPKSLCGREKEKLQSLFFIMVFLFCQSDNFCVWQQTLLQVVWKIVLKTHFPWKFSLLTNSSQML